MNTNVRKVLGREYTDSIEREIEKLKQSDKIMVGDITAVIKRSDRNLGRPENDCNKDSEFTYVIFEPSPYSIVCHKDINSIRNEGSDIVLLSLNSFVEQLLEFNFTYLQLLLCGDIKYESDYFIKLKHMMLDIMEKESDTVFHKNISLIMGIQKDIVSNKFKDDQLRNRLFLEYKVITMLLYYIEHKKWTLDDNINIDEYNHFVKNNTRQSLCDLGELYQKVIDYELDNIDTNEIKSTKANSKVNNKYMLMNSLVKKIMEDN